MRNVDEVRAVFEEGTTELGPVDIVLANAGIGPLSLDPQDQEWHDVIGVNLTGVFNTVRVAIPSMVEGVRVGRSR